MSCNLQCIHKVSKIAMQNQHKAAKAFDPAVIFHMDVLYVWLHSTHEASPAVLNHF